MNPPLLASSSPALTARAGVFYRFFRHGLITERYPACCVFQFAFDIATGHLPAERRPGSQKPYVPCSLHLRAERQR